ncbi:peptidase inhibitor family I36 protein [Amycolatopsis sp. H20-H5]|uniref:peptidase inhibitor family I36 protein n=1 Tax=Amycolatopsis sp. H20-H5 TaxID=3046309 RepID=UPI002DBD443C|nr:peptidase inhibitor family I36 protein [Amycolatopsis sp. H20-H5]MEC3976756.1 peptidase inhibitor family I36 protein [Amycolatopsis sp. H20-H5]
MLTKTMAGALAVAGIFAMTAAGPVAAQGASAPAKQDCPSGYACFWEGPHYLGRVVRIQRAGVTTFVPKVASWDNSRTTDMRVYAGFHQDGPSRCVQPGESSAGVEGFKAGSVRIYPSASVC